jgi:hypothetical protein
MGGDVDRGLLSVLFNSASSSARISDCGRYRYWLARDWYIGDVTPDPLTWIMLNPSTADAAQDDATITRCMRRAAALGFNGIRVVNLFALRSTDPEELARAEDPVGPENDQAILEACHGQRMVIAGWGTGYAALGDRATKVRHMLRELNVPLFALGLTKDRQPRHPLYVSYSTNPIPIQEP